MRKLTIKKIKINEKKFIQLLQQVEDIPNFRIQPRSNSIINSKPIKTSNKHIVSYCERNSFTTPVFHKGTFYRDKTDNAIMKIQIVETHKFYRKATEAVYTFPEKIFNWYLGSYKALNLQDKSEIKIWLINYCKAVFYYTNKVNKEKRKLNFLHKHKHKSK